MKVLIISDLHLTDKFDDRKYNQLDRLFKAVDQIVLAGDFWDGYLTKFDRFVKSQWSKLFPILKSRNTIYLFGNHDQSMMMDGRMNLFSVNQGLSHRIKYGPKTLVIEHGNRFAKDIDDRFPWIIPFANKYCVRFATFLSEGWRVVLWGKQGPNKPSSCKSNQAMKSWAKHHLKKNEILVCGHSHLAEFNPKEHFIGLGVNKYDFLQYLIIENNKLRLIH